MKLLVVAVCSERTEAVVRWWNFRKVNFCRAGNCKSCISKNLLLKMNETAYEAAAAWVELERFKSLNSLIDLRLGSARPSNYSTRKQ